MVSSISYLPQIKPFWTLSADVQLCLRLSPSWPSSATRIPKAKALSFSRAETLRSQVAGRTLLRPSLWQAKTTGLWWSFLNTIVIHPNWKYLEIRAHSTIHEYRHNVSLRNNFGGLRVCVHVADAVSTPMFSCHLCNGAPWCPFDSIPAALPLNLLVHGSAKMVPSDRRGGT